MAQKRGKMDNIQALASDIQKAQNIVAFTGAGISAESGIPTYRGEGGLWTKYDPSKYANIEHFRLNPSYYWNFFKEVRYPILKKVKPNKAHLALFEMENAGNLKTVITQNIDGLHQEAGSSSVIELHGTTRTIICVDCSSSIYALGKEIFEKQVAFSIGAHFAYKPHFATEPCQTNCSVCSRPAASFRVVLDKAFLFRLGEAVNFKKFVHIKRAKADHVEAAQ